MPKGAGQPMPETFCGFLEACLVHPFLIKYPDPLPVLWNSILLSVHPLRTTNPRHMPGATRDWMSPGPSSTTPYTRHRHTWGMCHASTKGTCSQRLLGSPSQKSPALPAELAHHVPGKKTRCPPASDLKKWKKQLSQRNTLRGSSRPEGLAAQSLSLAEALIPQFTRMPLVTISLLTRHTIRIQHHHTAKVSFLLSLAMLGRSRPTGFWEPIIKYEYYIPRRLSAGNQ